MFFTYLDANSMTKLSSIVDADADGSNRKELAGKDYMEHSKADLKNIREIMNFNGDLFSWLVHSLVPSIYGHNLVKAGLLLTLFGGRRRDTSSESRLSIRSDSHILVVRFASSVLAYSPFPAN